MTTVVLGLVVPAIVAVLVVHAIGAYVLARRMTRPKRVRVTGSPADMHIEHEDVVFAAADGVALYGWYLETPGARASVVIVHDNAGMRSDPAVGLIGLQRDYLRGGLNVLSFDLRGRGESSGLRDQLGAGELADVLGAVKYARRRSGAAIVLHGFGTGASLALEAAAHEGVEAVIADSPVASMRAYVRDRHSRAPAHLFALASLFARWRYGADVDAVAPVRCMQYLEDTQVLFVHCEDNRDVPIEHTLNLAAASLNEADEVWTHVEGGHCGAYRANPSDYMQRSLQFINHAILARVPAARAV